MNVLCRNCPGENRPRGLSGGNCPLGNIPKDIRSPFRQYKRTFSISKPQDVGYRIRKHNLNYFLVSFMNASGMATGFAQHGHSHQKGPEARVTLGAKGCMNAWMGTGRLFRGTQRQGEHLEGSGHGKSQIGGKCVQHHALYAKAYFS